MSFLRAFVVITLVPHQSTSEEGVLDDAKCTFCEYLKRSIIDLSSLGILTKNGMCMLQRPVYRMRM